MIYNALKFLFRLAVRGYFRSILVKGKENIPKSGPVLFAPNHPSAFMDPILLGSEINRKLYFLARGDVFRQRFASYLFSFVNMIPVFRQQDAEGHADKNEMIFQKCFDHLANGKSIMIFPEGLSKTERRLRPIKTGTARIALGAEGQNNFSLGVTIVPVGINYSNPHNFQTDVFVNFGKPIIVKEYQDLYTRDERQAVIDLTDRLKTEMESLLVIVRNEQFDNLIQRIEKVYLHQLRENFKPGDKLFEDFHLSKEVIAAVEFHFRKNPERLLAFENKLNAYTSELKELSVRDTQVRASRIRFNLPIMALYYIMGFPFYLYGLVTNYPPYRLAGMVANKLNFGEDFVGSIRLAGGTFVFLLAYLGEAILIGYLFSPLWAVAFMVSLYPAGLFSLGYSKKFLKTLGSFRMLRLFIIKSDRIARLKMMRAALIDELEVGKREYLSSFSTD